MPWTGTLTTKGAIHKAVSAAVRESRARRGAWVEIAGAGGWQVRHGWKDTKFGTFPEVEPRDPWGLAYGVGTTHRVVDMLDDQMRGRHDFAPERAGGPRRWVIREPSGDPRHPVGPFNTEAEAIAHRDKQLRGRGEIDVARPTDYPYAQGGKARVRRDVGALADAVRKATR